MDTKQEHKWKLVQPYDPANPLSPVRECVHCGVQDTHLDRQLARNRREWEELIGPCPKLYNPDFHLINVVAPHA